MTRTIKKAETNGHLPTADERVRKCGEAIAKALSEHGCQMYTALRIGNAEAPLVEIGGLPIVVKIGANDSSFKSERR